jgi:hypothetical protein
MAKPRSASLAVPLSEEESAPTAWGGRRDDRERRRLAEAAGHLSALTRQFTEALLAHPADPEALDELQRQINRAAAVQTRLFVEWQLALPRIVRVELPASPLTFREKVLAALEILGVPATPRQVGDVAALAGHGVLSPSRFASLRRDEQRAYAKDPDARPAWIVPALSAEDLGPVAGIVASSAWEPERRLIGARTERVNFLRQLLALLGMAAWPDIATDTARAARLADLIARAARSVLDPRRRWAPGEPAQIRAAVEFELTAIEPIDLGERRAAVVRLRELTPPERIWGRGGAAAPATAREAVG